MEEGAQLVDERITKLARLSLEELVSRFNGKKEDEFISAPSGEEYRITVDGSWDRGDSEWESDFYVWVRVRASQGWRRWRPWADTLVVYPEDRSVHVASKERGAASRQPQPNPPPGTPLRRFLTYAGLLLFAAWLIWIAIYWSSKIGGAIF